MAESKENRNKSAAPASPSLAVATAVFAAIYILYFFLSNTIRRGAVLHLFSPDRILMTWMGNSTSRFGLFDRLPIVTAALLIFLVALALGWLMLRCLRADGGLTRLEVFLFSLAAGLNTISLYTLAVGLCGGLQQQLLFLLPASVVLIVAAIWRRRGSPRKQPFTEVITPAEQSWFARHGLWLVVPFAVVILLGGILPPWKFDVRVYHLQVPKEWYLAGKVEFLPHNVYASMPLGSEMHAIIGMVTLQGFRDWWWGALVGKLIVATYAPLTALALFAAGQRFVSKTAGVIAAAGFISTSWVADGAMSGLIECASAYYLLLAFYAVLLWTRQEDVSDAQARGMIILAGYMAGSAVACKYPAVLFVVIPCGMWIFVHRWRLNWKPLVVFLIAVVFGCGLWLGKNWGLTGNPTYPLLYSVFGGESRTPEKDLQWRQGHAPGDLSLGHFGKMFGALAFVHPFVVPLSLLALFSKRHRRLVIVLVALLLYSLNGWWFLTHQMERFLVPTSPLLALLVGIGASCMEKKPWWRMVLVGATIATLAGMFLVLTVRRPTCDNRFFVSISSMRRDEFHQADPTHSRVVDPIHRYANDNMDKVDGILLVGGADAFDLEMRVMYNTVFDDCILEKLMKDRTQEERLAAFREHGISHVFVLWREITRYRFPGGYGFTEYVTRELLHKELCEEQNVLRKIDLLLDTQTMQIVDAAELPFADPRRYEPLDAEKIGEFFEVVSRPTPTIK